MSKKCAREECGKTVYPIEELKCLDKSWHKMCFRCTVCGMMLNMKNYKGYDKKPYCEPHYPKTVASVVADTPEMRRLQENSKFQSQAKYHAEYEKMRGTKIDIVDDPEVTRHRKNTQVQSNVQYHGDHEKRKIQEEQRPKEEVVESPAPTTTTISSPPSSLLTAKDLPSNKGSLTSLPSPNQSVDSDQQSRSTSRSGTIIFSTEQGGEVPVNQKHVGSIEDYDPLNGNWGSINNGTAIEKLEAVLSNGSSKSQISSIKQTQKENDVNNVNAVTNSLAKDLNFGKGSGFTVRALYDYTAADKDEVSFLEGDVIVNCQKVDEGWLTGTVQRTLTWGMLPANYVEKIVVKTGRFKLN